MPAWIGKLQELVEDGRVGQLGPDRATFGRRTGRMNSVTDRVGSTTRVVVPPSGGRRPDGRSSSRVVSRGRRVGDRAGSRWGDRRDASRVGLASSAPLPAGRLVAGEFPRTISLRSPAHRLVVHAAPPADLAARPVPPLWVVQQGQHRRLLVRVRPRQPFMRVGPGDVKERLSPPALHDLDLDLRDVRPNRGEHPMEAVGQPVIPASKHTTGGGNFAPPVQSSAYPATVTSLISLRIWAPPSR